MARRRRSRMLPYGFAKHVQALCYCCMCQGPNEGRREERKRARRQARQEIERELRDAE